jgi:hypothetical protein
MGTASGQLLLCPDAAMPSPLPHRKASSPYDPGELKNLVELLHLLAFYQHKQQGFNLL